MREARTLRRLTHRRGTGSSVPPLAMLLLLAVARVADAGQSSGSAAAPGSTPPGAPGAPGQPAAPQPLPVAALPSLDSVYVTEVWRAGGDSTRRGPRQRDSVRAGIGDVIIIRVNDLRSLMRRAKCQDASERPVASCQPQEIALFLDGREIKGIVPESGAPVPENQTLQFHLQRSAASDEAWADLLGAPPFGARFFVRPTRVSVGLENGYALPTLINRGGGTYFELVRARKAQFVIASIALAFLFGIFVWAAVSSNLLRDRDAPRTQPPAAGEPPPRPYSLARVQMAVWFCLVVASYLFIWAVTGASDTITASVLGLIGIGAGTALGAAVIDAGKVAAGTAELDSLRAEETTLRAEQTKLEAQIAEATDGNKTALELSRSEKRTRLGAVTARITQLSAQVRPGPSVSFLEDVLTDGDGYSFHRFQMFAWTIVLAILFIYSVWNRLSMPEFSATLLALMGISGGTYLGFKIPERQT